MARNVWVDCKPVDIIMLILFCIAGNIYKHFKTSVEKCNIAQSQILIWTLHLKKFMNIELVSHLGGSCILYIIIKFWKLVQFQDVSCQMGRMFERVFDLKLILQLQIAECMSGPSPLLRLNVYITHFIAETYVGY